MVSNCLFRLGNAFWQRLQKSILGAESRLGDLVEISVAQQREKNFSVVGALSRAFDILSVSGPAFQFKNFSCCLFLKYSDLKASHTCHGKQPSLLRSSVQLQTYSVKFICWSGPAEEHSNLIPTAAQEPHSQHQQSLLYLSEPQGSGRTSVVNSRQIAALSRSVPLRLFASRDFTNCPTEVQRSSSIMPPKASSSVWEHFVIVQN
ncbi:hypothetical protein HAX54_018290 [Datura stramonium]|uniref:Uncharacterized protein n=1 Tax=Datura stramonium TaxID=4076 RepID=A0ABS8ULY6_DATST|nr:hypothetical protein [Datura stramonium]